jgi:hypothetical protein
LNVPKTAKKVWQYMLHQPLCVHIKSPKTNKPINTEGICSFLMFSQRSYLPKIKSAMPQIFIHDPIFQSFLSWFTFSMKFLWQRCLKLCLAKHISTHYYSQLFL